MAIVLEQWEAIHAGEEDRLPPAARWRDPTDGTTHACGLVRTLYASIPGLITAEAWALGLTSRVAEWLESVER